MSRLGALIQQEVFELCPEFFWIKPRDYGPLGDILKDNIKILGQGYHEIRISIEERQQNIVLPVTDFSFNVTREMAPIYTLGSDGTTVFDRGRRSIDGKFTMRTDEFHLIPNDLAFDLFAPLSHSNQRTIPSSSRVVIHNCQKIGFVRAEHTTEVFFQGLSMSPVY